MLSASCMTWVLHQGWKLSHHPPFAHHLHWVEGASQDRAGLLNQSVKLCPSPRSFSLRLTCSHSSCGSGSCGVADGTYSVCLGCAICLRAARICDVAASGLSTDWVPYISLYVPINISSFRAFHPPWRKHKLTNIMTNLAVLRAVWVPAC